jgi:hypothetical protein
MRGPAAHRRSTEPSRPLASPLRAALCETRAAGLGPLLFAQLDELEAARERDSPAHRNAASPTSPAIVMPYTRGSVSARSTEVLAGSSGATSKRPGVCHAKA